MRFRDHVTDAKKRAVTSGDLVGQDASDASTETISSHSVSGGPSSAGRPQGRFAAETAESPESAVLLTRIAIPTRDRPGSLPLALVSLAMHTQPTSQLVLYDGGDVLATREYGTRFGLDLARRRGMRVSVQVEVARGIHLTRAAMLRDAKKSGVERLLMVDDDIVLGEDCLAKLQRALDEDSVAYVVPIVRLANNEASVSDFGNPDPNRTEHQQFVTGRTGRKLVVGGAWTCAIMFDLRRFDVEAAVRRLASGPPVVEDYVLTEPLEGEIVQDAEVWHAMTPDQGDRGWEGRALAYLRGQVAAGKTR